MRCRDFESLLIEAWGRKLEAAEEMALADHAARCARCQVRLADWQKLRSVLPSLAAPRLSSELEEKVRNLCHAEISRKRRPAPVPSRRKDLALPAFFWPTFGTLVFLTVALLVPGLRALLRYGLWTFPAILAVVLVVQNGLTLLFAPLVLARRPKNGTSCG
jgi:anti-sigma factor RsiW